MSGALLGGLVGIGMGAIFGALSGWVVAGASWVLHQIGTVLAVTTGIDVGASWFQSHYRVMATVGAAFVLPFLLAAVVQAVVHQSPGSLVRSVGVHLPVAMVATGAAVPVVGLALAATDALSARVSSGTGVAVAGALSGVSRILTLAPGAGVPAFVVLLGALLVVVGAFLVWVELLIRSAALYAALLFLPLALAGLVWPATAHWCRRLVETLAALILSKFAIVAILSLGAAGLSSGIKAGNHGFAAVLAGGALLLVAAASPLTLLRMIPAIEAGAVHQLEAVRARAAGAVWQAPRSAAQHALQMANGAALGAGSPGTGESPAAELPGAEPSLALGPRAEGAAGVGTGAGGDGAGGPPGGAIPWWPGDPAARSPLEAPEEGSAEGSGHGSRGPLPAVWAPRSPGRDANGAGAPGPGRTGGGEGGPKAGGYVIEKDAHGPVLRWIRPEGHDDDR